MSPRNTIDVASALCKGTSAATSVSTARTGISTARLRRRQSTQEAIISAAKAIASSAWNEVHGSSCVGVNQANRAQKAAANGG